MVDFFTAPMDQDGLKSMLSFAEMARERVDGCARYSLPAQEVRSIKMGCTAKRAAAAWLHCFVLGDFKRGLTRYALDVVRYGWGALGPHDVNPDHDSDHEIMACITGLD